MSEQEGGHPPDPEKRSPAAANGRASFGDFQSQQNIETRTDAQVGFLRRRFSVCYSLAASLASLLYGLGPR
jgi:hypothetical protein